jgi:hypothetical protein
MKNNFWETALILIFVPTGKLVFDVVTAVQEKKSRAEKRRKNRKALSDKSAIITPFEEIVFISFLFCVVLLGGLCLLITEGPNGLRRALS